MINFGMPVPDDETVALDISHAGVLIIESLYLLRGDLDGAHFLVDDANLKF